MRARPTRSVAPSTPPRAALAVALVLAFVVAACLPASIRPTAPPAPTPTPSPTVPPTPTPTPGPPTPTPAPTFALYTVARGDTLTSIARHFKTSGRSVAYWNRASYPSLDPEGAHYNPNNLQVGWVLQVLPGQEYVPPEDDGESGEEVTPRPAEEPTDEGVSYEPSP
jgi:hypothetical protein